VSSQILKVGEGSVKNLHVEAFASQVRANVEDAQWNVGLHDLQFFRIIVEKIPVSEEKIGHLKPVSRNS
jgi:hypothetical protein